MAAALVKLWSLQREMNYIQSSNFWSPCAIPTCDYVSPRQTVLSVAVTRLKHGSIIFESTSHESPSSVPDRKYVDVVVLHAVSNRPMIETKSSGSALFASSTFSLTMACDWI